MKANKCMHCDNRTFQKDGICVICRIGIAGMCAELARLLNKEENRIKLRAAKLRRRR